MLPYAFLAMAGVVSALPLNINLGAYSPALVVGDGEISFGGNEDVSNLMNVLEGAAVNTAAGVANNAATGATVTNEVPAGTATTVAAAAAAAAADPLVEQAQQIASLQGIGNKSIAPRVQLVDVADADAEIDVAAPAPVAAKRDLAGFDRALQYAEAALTKGPKVQLGTGREGSGVGIIVDNGPTTSAAKRDDVASSPKRVRAKVTTMYVRSGLPAALQSKRDETASADPPVTHAVVPRTPAVARRDALDAVNLNVDGDQGLTMTFVETVADGEED